jgi:hypothetical protein
MFLLNLFDLKLLFIYYIKKNKNEETKLFIIKLIVLFKNIINLAM